MAKILLVVHNRSELRRLAGGFEQLGHTVLSAPDGLAGFQAFQAERPDAVVIDLLIPKLPGGELCRRIKDDPLGQATPVVVLSGLFKKTDMAERALEQWGADRYLQSPVDPAALVAEIESLLGAPRRAAPRPASRPPAATAAPAEEFTESETAELDSIEAAIARAVGELRRHDLIDRAPRVARINEEIALAAATDGDALAALLAELDGVSPADQAARPSAAPSPAPDDEDFPRRGSLADLSVPELAAHLYFEKKTGILEIASQGTLKQVYFNAGRAIHVESEIRQESLGQSLVREGVIKQEDVMLSLANMAAYGTRQGGALVQLGILSPMQIYQALRTQMREKLLNLFQWFSGTYFFDESPFDKTKLTVFELSMPRLIFDGVRSAYDPDDVREMFADVLNQPIEPTAPLPFPEDEADLPAAVWRLFGLIDGKRTIAEVVAASPEPENDSIVDLYAMLVLRMYDHRSEDEFAAETKPGEAAAPEPKAAPAAPAPPLAIEAEIVFADQPPAAGRGLTAIDERDSWTGAARPTLKKIDEVTATPEENEELARDVVELFLKLENANCYELLDVPRDADETALKLSYYALMKKFHEDRVRGRLDAELTEKALHVAQALTSAYETLSSPSLRAEYDRRLTGEGGELKERRITTILAAERAFNDGTRALRRRDFPVAEQAFGEACELFPEEGEYHAYFGWAQYQNHRRRPAERSVLAKASIERALRLNPKGDKAYFFLGKILMQHPDTRDKARHMFALSFRYNKNNEEARGELRRLQAERDKEHADVAARASAKTGLGAQLKKDIDFGVVKRAVKKIFF